MIERPSAEAQAWSLSPLNGPATPLRDVGSVGGRRAQRRAERPAKAPAGAGRETNTCSPRAMAGLYALARAASITCAANAARATESFVICHLSFCVIAKRVTWAARAHVPRDSFRPGPRPRKRPPAKAGYAKPRPRALTRVWSVCSAVRALASPTNIEPLVQQTAPRAAAHPRYLVSRQFARRNSDWITSRTSVSKVSGVDLQF